jgi:hypothetical protein
MDGVAEWKFAGGAGLQTYEAPDRAGGGSATLAVSGIERHARALRASGIEPQVVGNERVKTLMIQDPDGNSIALAEATDPQLLR